MGQITMHLLESTPDVKSPPGGAPQAAREQEVYLLLTSKAELTMGSAEITLDLEFAEQIPARGASISVMGLMYSVLELDVSTMIATLDRPVERAGECVQCIQTPPTPIHTAAEPP